MQYLVIRFEFTGLSIFFQDPFFCLRLSNKLHWFFATTFQEFEYRPWYSLETVAANGSVKRAEGTKEYLTNMQKSLTTIVVPTYLADMAAMI